MLTLIVIFLSVYLFQDFKKIYYSLICFRYCRFQSVAVAFIHTLNKHLGNKFTSKVKEAWTAVYGLMAENRDGGQVTEEQIELVQETWGLLKDDLEKMGVEFYVR